MFLFLEGESDLPDAQVGDIVEYVYIDEPITFECAIRELASRSSRAVGSVRTEPEVVTVFYHFLKNISHLELWQRRGLERIMLGDNALELTTLDDRGSRFIAGITGVPPGITPELTSIVESWYQNKSFHEGIGRFSPGNTLFVGESPGKNSMGFNTPFVGSGSGKWLTEQLEIADIHEGFYYWINAKDGVGKPADQSIIQKLKPLRVIALGKEALKWVNEAVFLECEIKYVPHPQYWKRFNSKLPYPLIDLLRHAPVAL